MTPLLKTYDSSCRLSQAFEGTLHPETLNKQRESVFLLKGGEHADESKSSLCLSSIVTAAISHSPLHPLVEYSHGLAISDMSSVFHSHGTWGGKQRGAISQADVAKLNDVRVFPLAADGSFASKSDEGLLCRNGFIKRKAGAEWIAPKVNFREHEWGINFAEAIDADGLPSPWARKPLLISDTMAAVHNTDIFVHSVNLDEKQINSFFKIFTEDSDFANEICFHKKDDVHLVLKYRDVIDVVSKQAYFRLCKGGLPKTPEGLKHWYLKIQSEEKIILHAAQPAKEDEERDEERDTLLPSPALMRCIRTLMSEWTGALPTDEELADFRHKLHLFGWVALHANVWSLCKYASIINDKWQARCATKMNNFVAGDEQKKHLFAQGMRWQNFVLLLLYSIQRGTLTPADREYLIGPNSPFLRYADDCLNRRNGFVLPTLQIALHSVREHWLLEDAAYAAKRMNVPYFMQYAVHSTHTAAMALQIATRYLSHPAAAGFGTTELALSTVVSTLPSSANARSQGPQWNHSKHLCAMLRRLGPANMAASISEAIFAAGAHRSHQKVSFHKTLQPLLTQSPGALFRLKPQNGVSICKNPLILSFQQWTHDSDDFSRLMSWLSSRPSLPPLNWKTSFFEKRHQSLTRRNAEAMTSIALAPSDGGERPHLPKDTVQRKKLILYECLNLWEQGSRGLENDQPLDWRALVNQLLKHAGETPVATYWQALSVALCGARQFVRNLSAVLNCFPNSPSSDRWREFELFAPVLSEVFQDADMFHVAEWWRHCADVPLSSFTSITQQHSTKDAHPCAVLNELKHSLGHLWASLSRSAATLEQCISKIAKWMGHPSNVKGEVLSSIKNTSAIADPTWWALLIEAGHALISLVVPIVTNPLSSCLLLSETIASQVPLVHSVKHVLLYSTSIVRQCLTNHQRSHSSAQGSLVLCAHKLFVDMASLIHLARAGYGLQSIQNAWPRLHGVDAGRVFISNPDSLPQGTHEPRAFLKLCSETGISLETAFSNRSGPGFLAFPSDNDYRLIGCHAVNGLVTASQEMPDTTEERKAVKRWDSTYLMGSAMCQHLSRWDVGQTEMLKAFAEVVKSDGPTDSVATAYEAFCEELHWEPQLILDTVHCIHAIPKYRTKLAVVTHALLKNPCDLPKEWRESNERLSWIRRLLDTASDVDGLSLAARMGEKACKSPYDKRVMSIARVMEAMQEQNPEQLASFQAHVRKRKHGEISGDANTPAQCKWKWKDTRRKHVVVDKGSPLAQEVPAQEKEIPPSKEVLVQEKESPLSKEGTKGPKPPKPEKCEVDDDGDVEMTDV